jgi:hypothetical protein
MPTCHFRRNSSLFSVHTRCQGVGVGHSWWSEQMCAANSAEGVDLLLTELSDKRIVVDESAMTAKIDAGIILHDALDYLASYGKGYTLGSFPWCALTQHHWARLLGTDSSSTVPQVYVSNCRRRGGDRLAWLVVVVRQPVQR